MLNTLPLVCPQNMRSTFLNIGERCNVAGSSIFKKAIVEGNWDKAVQIANSQVCLCDLMVI